MTALIAAGPGFPRAAPPAYIINFSISTALYNTISNYRSKLIAYLHRKATRYQRDPITRFKPLSPPTAPLTFGKYSYVGRTNQQHYAIVYAEDESSRTERLIR